MLKTLVTAHSSALCTHGQTEKPQIAKMTGTQDTSQQSDNCPVFSLGN